jgi:hypothetical protein
VSGTVVTVPLDIDGRTRGCRVEPLERKLVGIASAALKAEEGRDPEAKVADGVGFEPTRRF